MKLVRMTLTIAVIVAGLIVVPATANAATAAPANLPAVTVLGPVIRYPDTAAANAPAAHCEGHTWARIDSAQPVFFWDRITHFRDGPGGTMTGTVTIASTISATVTVGAKISVNDLVAAAEVSVSASVTVSATTTIGHTYSHTVTAGKYGNMQFGAWGYNVSWSQWYRHPDCSLTELASGGGTVPTVATGWNYWEN